MPKPAPIFAPGDLLFFSGRGFISAVIKAFTCWPWDWFRPSWRCVSHVGICAAYNGELYLFESTTLCDQPCAITGKKRAGVQAHKPEDRIASYDGHVFHAKTGQKYFAFGYQAWLNGDSKLDNPYAKGIDKWRYWAYGYYSNVHKRRAA